MKKAIIIVAFAILVSLCGCYIFIPNEVRELEAANLAKAEVTIGRIETGELDPEAAYPVLKQITRGLETNYLWMIGKDAPNEN